MDNFPGQISDFVLNGERFVELHCFNGVQIFDLNLERSRHKVDRRAPNTARNLLTFDS